jgi:hypothetical protein
MAKFMNLPSELRNKIYDFAMIPQHDTLTIHSVVPRGFVSTMMMSPVFRLSSEIRTEALVQLLRTKRFVMDDIRIAENFLYFAGELAQDHLLDLVIICPTTPEYQKLMPNDSFFMNLRKLKALRKLRFELGTSRENMADCMNFGLCVNGKVERIPKVWMGFKMHKDLYSKPECEITIERWK